MKAGHVFVSNGPLLRCRASGELPGHVFKAPPGQETQLALDVALDSRDPLDRIEVIKNGKILQTIKAEEWNRNRQLPNVSFTESGWFLIRVMGDVPETFRFASTGPFYVEIEPQVRRISKASAQFFLDWVHEREALIKLDNPQQQEQVMQYHGMAEKYWQDKIAKANAE